MDNNIDYDEVLAIVVIMDEKSEQRIIGSASLKFKSQQALKLRQSWESR